MLRAGDVPVDARRTAAALAAADPVAGADASARRAALRLPLPEGPPLQLGRGGGGRAAHSRAAAGRRRRRRTVHPLARPAGPVGLPRGRHSRRQGPARRPCGARRAGAGRSRRPGTGGPDAGAQARAAAAADRHQGQCRVEGVDPAQLARPGGGTGAGPVAPAQPDRVQVGARRRQGHRGATHRAGRPAGPAAGGAGPRRHFRTGRRAAGDRHRRRRHHRQRTGPPDRRIGTGTADPARCREFNLYSIEMEVREKFPTSTRVR